jgi:magnesium chelatase family protein
MSYAVVASRALDGVQAPPVMVEVHLANGLPSFTLVGLADTEVKEARERVRAALAQSGFEFPHNRRITVNLAPADLPKESARFDLPMALGILAAQGIIDPQRLAGWEFAGELSLAGALRPVTGAVALALGARKEGACRGLVLPADSAALAARVPGLEVRSASHLGEVVQSLLPQGAAAPGAAGGRAGPPRWARSGRCPGADGGPPGAGDRGRRWPQPAPDRAARLGQVHAGPAPAGPAAADDRRGGPRKRGLQGLGAGGLETDSGCTRPVRAPHHSASSVALVGGGSPHGPARFPWRMVACCFWTNCRNSHVPPWKPCASRWRAATSPSRGRPARPASRRASSWWRP